MTDRNPYFYRVVRMYNGSREYMARLGTWASQPCFASLFSTIERARHHVLRGERIVPVYVKVTRKPKRYHSIAWAAKQVQLGKHVVCDDVIGAPTYQTAIRVMMRSRKWRFANDGETYGTV